MTEAVRMYRVEAAIPYDTIPPETYEVGDIIEAQVAEKSVEGTSVLLDQRLVKMAADLEVVEEVGEKLRLEVAKATDDALELRYIRPSERPVADKRSVSAEQKKAFEIPKEYSKELIRAVKTMTPEESRRIDQMVSKVKEDVTVLVDTMTDSDVKSMLQDGLNPEKLSIDLMTRIVKSNRETFRKYDIEKIEVDVEKEVKAFEEKYKDNERLEAVIKTLKKNDLPVIKKHVDRMMDAMQKVDQIAEKAETDERWINVLKVAQAEIVHTSNENDKGISIEKLYKAVTHPVPKDRPIDMPEKELEKMVTDHLKQLNFKGNEQEVAVAKKMVRQDIPITREAVAFAIESRESIVKTPESVVLDKMVEKIVAAEPMETVKLDVLQVEAAGTEESRVPELQAGSARADLQSITQAHQLTVKLAAVTNDQIIRAAVKTPDLNLKAVFEQTSEPIQPAEWTQLKEAVDVGNSRADRQQLVIRHRQIEEIRLKMTIEAAVRLEKTGLKIETEPLEKLVNALKAYEHEMVELQDTYKPVEVQDSHRQIEVQGSHVEESIVKAKEVVHKAERADLILKTVEHYQSMQYLSEDVVAKVIEEDIQLIGQVAETVRGERDGEFQRTLNRLDSNEYKTEARNEAVQAKASNASHAYEQSETKVRRDLGDRVEKTFTQIKPMLESMDIEPTDQAVKAVQILARNEMPITEENILEIQLVQEKVDYVTTRMNPRLVIEMVNIGITPLDLTIDETIEIIEQYDEKFGETEAEKISRLIHDLKQEGLMTEEQKESLMGIYRTFDTVVRSKGAATGFLVKNHMPLNLSKLFEAAKFIRKSGQIKPVITADIDDSFGRLKHIEKGSVSIRQQVMTAIEKLELPDSAMVRESAQILSDMDVPIEKVNVLSKILMDMTLKSFVHSMSNEGLVAAENSIESTHFTDVQEVPLKALADGSVGNDSIQPAKKTETPSVQALARFIKENPEIMKTMVKNDIPMTLENVQKAIEINREPFTLLTKLREMIESVDNAELKSRIIEKISDTSREILSGERTIDSLRDTISEVEKEVLTFNENGLAEMSRLASDTVKTMNHTQMLQLTEDYYQIPVMMGNELSQLNMYILHDANDSLGSEEDSMKVIMRFKTRNLGDVTAYMEIKANNMSLNLQTSNESDHGLLKGFESQIRDLVEASDFVVSDVGYKTLSHETPIGKIQEMDASDLESIKVEQQKESGSFEIQV